MQPSGEAVTQKTGTGGGNPVEKVAAANRDGEAGKDTRQMPVAGWRGAGMGAWGFSSHLSAAFGSLAAGETGIREELPRAPGFPGLTPSPPHQSGQEAGESGSLPL